MIGKRTSRRDFLKTAAAGAAAAMLPLPAIAQGAGGRVVVVGGGFAGATCARFIKRIDPRITVTLVEASQTFTACPFSNRRHRRVARAQGAAVRLRQARRRSGRAQLRAGHRGRPAGSRGDARQWRAPALRPPGAGAGHRHPLGRPARLYRGRGRAHAACLESGRADAAAAPPARGDGGRRHGRHFGARQSVPLPARSLRAGKPDRVLSQDQEAEIEADHPRRQGRLLETGPVPQRLEGALSRISNGSRCRRAARSPRSMSAR